MRTPVVCSIVTESNSEAERLEQITVVIDCLGLHANLRLHAVAFALMWHGELTTSTAMDN